MNNLILLLSHPRLGIRIEDEIAPTGIAVDLIFTPVEIGDEGYYYLPAALAALEEVFSLIVEMIEEGPGYGLEDRCLA